MKLVVLMVSLTALIAWPLDGLAAEPTEVPSPTQSQAARLTQASGFARSSETTIAGMVVDDAGTPLDNVSVKLYVGGILLSEVATSPDGSFEMVELIDYAADMTIDLWFVSDNDDIVMENIILKESTAAVQHGLYSPCVERVRLDPITDVVVKLRTLEQRTTWLARSGCTQ